MKQLSDFYNEDTTGMLLAPYAKLGDKIALGAWTVPDDFEAGGTNGTSYLATCTKFDEDAFSASATSSASAAPSGSRRTRYTPAARKPTPPGWRNWQTRPT